MDEGFNEDAVDMVLLFRMGHLKSHLKMRIPGEYLPRDGASERSGADDEIIDITIWKIIICSGFFH